MVGRDKLYNLQCTEAENIIKIKKEDIKNELR